MENSTKELINDISRNYSNAKSASTAADLTKAFNL